MRRRVLVLPLVIASLGCAPDSGPADVVSAVDSDADVVLEMFDMGYRPDHIEIPRDTHVTVHLVNTGSLRHDLVLPDGTESETLNAEESIEVEIGPLAETVTAWCSVPGHRNAGMELEIVVTE